VVGKSVVQMLSLMAIESLASGLDDAVDAEDGSSKLGP